MKEALTPKKYALVRKQIQNTYNWVRTVYLTYIMNLKLLWMQCHHNILTKQSKTQLMLALAKITVLQLLKHNG